MAGGKAAALCGVWRWDLPLPPAPRWREAGCPGPGVSGRAGSPLGLAAALAGRVLPLRESLQPKPPARAALGAGGRVEVKRGERLRRCPGRGRRR